MSFYNLIPWRSAGEQRPAMHHGWSSFDRLQSQFNDLFNEFFGKSQLAEGASGWNPVMPNVDVSETDAEVHVTADLPGMDEKDVDVTLENGVLTIKGEKKFEQEDKQKNYHHVERAYGSFQRAVSIPAEVDSERVEATFKNGVLTVVLPKLEPGPTSKHIEVRRLN